MAFLDLCGIIAKGESFSAAGRFRRRSRHLWIVAKPCFAFLVASTCICLIASGSNADTCGPFSTAASSLSLVQSLPTDTGQPCFEYPRSIAAAGCDVVRARGYTSPQIFIRLFVLCPIISLANRWRCSAVPSSSPFVEIWFQCKGGPTRLSFVVEVDGGVVV